MENGQWYCYPASKSSAKDVVGLGGKRIRQILVHRNHLSDVPQINDKSHEVSFRKTANYFLVESTTPMTCHEFLRSNE